ncbi:MAG: FMN-binding protein, partial [Clostridia bacterium]|nr:FMN-binding protein [Clostridia bacterium]
TQENSFSKVTVIVGAKNGQITSCRIESEGDQDLLTDEIRNEWAKAIIESGSATPDAITGSTLKFSAQSVQDAVAAILAQMSGEAPAEAKAEEAAPETTETPTEEPTAEPTEEPTAEPTEEPTEEPTAEPMEEPTAEPTTEPTAKPAEEPATEQAEEPAAEEKSEAASEEPKTPPAYAGYRADRENDFSKVTVIVTRKDGKLTAVKILSTGEQDLLTDEIRDEWAKAILESGSAAPDAITGATLKFSAQSVQDAVEEILEKAAVPGK